MPLPAVVVADEGAAAEADEEGVGLAEAAVDAWVAVDTVVAACRAHHR